MPSIAQQAKDLREKLGPEEYERFLRQTSVELVGVDYLDPGSDKNIFTKEVLAELDARILALHSEKIIPVSDGPIEGS